MYDPGVAARLEHVFAEDLPYARRVDLDTWRTRRLWHRMLELIAWPLRDQL